MSGEAIKVCCRYRYETSPPPEVIILNHSQEVSKIGSLIKRQEK
jgi:hypothetical protein